MHHLEVCDQCAVNLWSRWPSFVEHIDLCPKWWRCLTKVISLPLMGYSKLALVIVGESSFFHYESSHLWGPCIFRQSHVMRSREAISTIRFHGNFCVGSPRNFPSMIYLPIPKPFRQVRVDRTNYYVGTYYWDILPKYIICWEHLDYIVYICTYGFYVGTPLLAAQISVWWSWLESPAEAEARHGATIDSRN